MLSGGRYRPMTLAVFAVVWQFFDDSPLPYHLLVVLIYAFLIVILYKSLLAIDWPGADHLHRFMAFSAALLFAAHPIHTEVVANVKGLDETFSLLFSLLSLLASVTFINKGNIRYLTGAMAALFIALLSKESAAPFVVLIPTITYLFLQKSGWSNTIKLGSALVLTFAVYFTIRTSIIGFQIGHLPSEMMNNPFIKVVDGQYLPFTLGEKWASILLGLGKYIQLLFFPHPLSHDYYPRQFAVVYWTSPEVILAGIMNVSLIAIAIAGIAKKSFTSFCILFFYATIGLTANIIFPIGTHLSERFLFTPSLALCLFVSYVVIKLHKTRFRNIILLPLALLIILFSIKTIDRNRTWVNDYTLFTTDVLTSKNSAKINNAAGGAIIDHWLRTSDPLTKNTEMSKAIGYLNRAVEIHPRYKNAYLLMGNANSYLEEYDPAIQAYTKALNLDPYYDQASENLEIAYREAGRAAGQKEGNITKAKQYLSKALEINPNSYNTLSLMGIAHGNEGNHQRGHRLLQKSNCCRW